MIGTEVIPMQSAYIVTGTLTDAQTVTLDEALPLTSTKVRLVIEPLSSTSPRQYREVIAQIRERQRARGHKPPTREEVDAYLQVERDSWGE
jgi:carbohydrate-binding DOMON domain-containing protein